MQNSKTRTVAGLGLFTAIVIVLQFLGSFIKFGPFSISLVLIPIVVGAALYGFWGGAWLGFVFSVAVFLSGDAGLFLAVNPLGTILTVILKGTLAGLAAGLVYHWLGKKEVYLNLTVGGQEKWSTDFAVSLAAIVAPVVNTGIFLIGCRLFFYETVAGWADASGFGDHVVRYMFLGLVGGNFLFELLVNLILSPVIVRLIKLGQKK